MAGRLYLKVLSKLTCQQLGRMLQLEPLRAIRLPKAKSGSHIGSYVVLIMLFEFLSSSLIEWLPFWLHIKVAITLWLVFPYSGGAAYAYDRFVRPCFVFDLRSLKIGYWLRSKRDDSRIRNSGDFLLLVEKYDQEKGSEALEEFVFGKMFLTVKTTDKPSILSGKFKDQRVSSTEEIDYQSSSSRTLWSNYSSREDDTLYLLMGKELNSGDED